VDAPPLANPLWLVEVTSNTEIIRKSLNFRKYLALWITVLCKGDVSRIFMTLCQTTYSLKLRLPRSGEVSRLLERSVMRSEEVKLDLSTHVSTPLHKPTLIKVVL